MLTAKKCKQLLATKQPNKFVKVDKKLRAKIIKEKGKGKYPKVNIPPSAVSAEINTNKDAKLWLRYTSPCARGGVAEHKVYNPMFRECKNIMKHKRASKLDYDKIVDKYATELKRSKSANKREVAGILYVVAKTGQRIGAKKNTEAGVYKTVNTKERNCNGTYKKKRVFVKNVKTYGLSTLLAKHVKVKGNIVTFDYLGKKGERQHHSYTDKIMADYYRSLLRGKRPNDPIHSECAYSTVFSHINGKGENLVKDFRTAFAHKWVPIYKQEYARKHGKPTSKSAEKKQIRYACEKVSERLGNKPAEVRRSYANPADLELTL